MTFSIVARNGSAVGVATATGGPVVGSLVSHARSRVGAIATQSSTNPFYGIDGIDLLAGGRSAQEVIAEVTGADAHCQARQCVVIGMKGPPAGWTGRQVEEVAGLRLGEDYALAGNMLAEAHVLDDMARAFTSSTGQFEDRLLAALGAADAAGGDRRGTRSAALLVYREQRYPDVDIRVDWSTSPISALADVLAAVRASDYADFFADRPRR